MRALGLAVCAAVLFVALAGTAAAQGKRPLPALAPAPADGLTRALEANRITEAEYALERARSLFELVQVRRSFGAVERPGLRDTTAILRDLALRQDELAGFDRTLARSLLARPDDGIVDPQLGNGWQPTPASTDKQCSATLGVDVCVHWVSEPGHPDAPDLADEAPANGLPDFVDTVLETLDAIWLAQIGSIGYRTPKSDVDSFPNNGGGPELDIYIDDLDDVAFGYCTTDDPLLGDPDVYDLSAYCVLDNDYASFGPLPPEDYLRVTAAHEFFHAVQYAYDAFEDWWLLEGTATNMETTVYPEIRDNLSFLSFSPLTRPASPLDRYGFLDSEYGSWIFFRFLEEKVADDAAIIREIWERADASAEKAYGDMYSLQAVRSTLAARGVGFPHAFAQFGRANRLRDYVDGAHYPAPPFTKKWALGRKKASTGWRSWRINHLATRHYSFRPGKGATTNGKLRIRVRLPRSDARATAIVVRPGGKTATRYLTRNAKGVAGTNVRRFSRSQARRVHLVLTNGSTKTDCWLDDSGPPYSSCSGVPRHDRLVFELRARLRR